jgi:hypothetical protein
MESLEFDTMGDAATHFEVGPKAIATRPIIGERL